MKKPVSRRNFVKTSLLAAATLPTLVRSEPGASASASQSPDSAPAQREALPTGRYLVATMNNSLVREIDVQGKTLWQASFPGVFRATRLPNGHTLVASMTTKKVAELDRNGQVRWEKTCEGRPWGVHWR